MTCCICIADILVDFICGGMATFSIAGIFSYDCQTNITSGFVVTGSNMPPWAAAISEIYPKISHPITVVLLMAEAMMEASLNIRRGFHEMIEKMESTTEGILNSLNTATSVGKLSQDSKDYRSLALTMSDINRMFGLTQITLGRSRVCLDFAARYLDPNQESPFLRHPCRCHLARANATLLSRARAMVNSVDHLKSEVQNIHLRIQTQDRIISNLIAQQDVALSIEVATDSRELAAASRRDGSEMKIIAILGTIFLPGTFTAVRQLFESLWFLLSRLSLEASCTSNVF
jgi:hypothetical protein